MRNLRDLILFAIVVGGAGYYGYHHQAQLHTLVRVAQQYVAPCSSPLTYSIGTVDSRFGITQNILKEDLKYAEAIWEDPTGKDLFEYLPSGGDVTVNLIYDSRQEATDKLAAAGIKIDNTKASYDSLKERYDALSTRIDTEQAQYEAKVAQYKQDEFVYNSEVKKSNARGGATPAEYDQLQAKKAALEQEFQNVKVLEGQLNSDISTINALATTLNQLIVQLNLNVDQYNRTGAAAGEFEEGRYQLADGIQTIDIYEYSNHNQLVRVLAHEMGHALGFEHVDDVTAIMYKINSGTKLEATTADLTEFNRVCK